MGSIGYRYKKNCKDQPPAASICLKATNSEITTILLHGLTMNRKLYSQKTLYFAKWLIFRPSCNYLNYFSIGFSFFTFSTILLRNRYQFFPQACMWILTVKSDQCPYSRLNVSLCQISLISVQTFSSLDRQSYFKFIISIWMFLKDLLLISSH